MEVILTTAGIPGLLLGGGQAGLSVGDHTNHRVVLRVPTTSTKKPEPPAGGWVTIVIIQRGRAGLSGWGRWSPWRGKEKPRSSAGCPGVQGGRGEPPTG